MLRRKNAFAFAGIVTGMVIGLAVQGIAGPPGSSSGAGDLGFGQVFDGSGSSADPDATVARKATSRDEPDQDSDKVGDIDEGETGEVKRRKEALHLASFGFGPGGVTNLDTDPLNYHFYGGYMWEPHPNGGVKLLGNVTTDFNTSVSALLDIGANFYMLRTAATPYVGAALGLGYIHAEDENEAGFTASGSAGMMFFRTSDVHLNLEFKTSVHIEQVNDKNPVVMTGNIGLSI
ncbi:MAG: hypothetical protein GF331_27370 [Chitinivibrionales bacterium]|nr:hypothetical protein [Chitinivibrionales bacterium]